MKYELKIEIKDKTGEIVNVKATPAAINIFKLAASMLRIEQEFGLTPSARSGIVGTQAKQKDDMQDFFDKHG